MENVKPGEKEENLVEEKLKNWVTEKEILQADCRFEDLISRNGGENILWKMNKNFPPSISCILTETKSFLTYIKSQRTHYMKPNGLARLIYF